MDPGQVITIAIVAAAIWYGPRLVLGSVGAAGDVVAELFVPPDRSLGWPHGVQESDAAWGWRIAPATAAASTGGSAAAARPVDGPTITLDELDLLDAPIRTGSYVVPVQRIRPD